MNEEVATQANASGSPALTTGLRWRIAVRAFFYLSTFLIGVDNFLRDESLFRTLDALSKEMIMPFSLLAVWGWLIGFLSIFTNKNPLLEIPKTRLALALYLCFAVATILYTYHRHTQSGSYHLGDPALTVFPLIFGIYHLHTIHRRLQLQKGAADRLNA